MFRRYRYPEPALRIRPLPQPFGVPEPSLARPAHSLHWRRSKPDLIETELFTHAGARDCFSRHIRTNEVLACGGLLPRHWLRTSAVNEITSRSIMRRGSHPVYALAARPLRHCSGDRRVERHATAWVISPSALPWHNWLAGW